ncbi:MAG: S-layer homology domain-containing protein, partial [Clostridia bacterium]
VGGLLGSNAGIDQCWVNGIGYIRDNVFYGTLTGEKNVGGLVGYYSSLNRYNIIENNYYYDTNGCDTPVGGVEHIDTNTHEFGMGDDGIFYYDTSTDSLDDIKDFVDAEDKGTGDWQYTSVCKTDHNRTDDPMGADKEKLGKSCTVEEMANGTVLKLLNESETGMKNWMQGERFPVLDNAAVITSLAISGDYKTTFYIGDELDLTGAIFTATWSDGSTSIIAAEDVVVEGFDSSTRQLLTLIASYKGVSVEFQVRVGQRPVSSDITVYFTMYGDTIHGDPTEETGTHTWADQNLELWIEKTAYTVDMNSTVKDVLEKALSDNNMTCANKTGNYVSSITRNGETLAEFSNGGYSGWMYTLNGKYPDLGVAEQFLEDGDVIVWHYTDDYTKEENAIQWKIMEMISALPATENLTLEDSDAVAAAREAYNALTEDQQRAVSNLDVLEAAEARIVALQNQMAADEVIAKVNALPAVEDLTLEDAEAVGAAQDVYDALIEAQKALVPEDVLAHLTAARARIDELMNPRPTDLPFTDLKEDGWYLDSVRYVYFNGMMKGMSETSFEPDTALTRAMYVTMLYRLSGEPAVKVGNVYADVKGDEWYAKAVSWGTENGIVEGYDGKFSPMDSITREQMAAMMYRYAELNGCDVSASASFDTFSDGNTVSDWAKEEMGWAVASKLIQGHEDGTLEPQGNATRAQAAAVLQRFAEMIQN